MNSNMNIPVLSWFVITIGLIEPLSAVAQEVFEPPLDTTVFWATRLNEEIVVDGELNESIWQRTEAITEFIQQDPVQGAPASYPTEVRILYDDEALYISAICYQPIDSTRVQNLRRDFSEQENDLFGIAIDGFLDKRNTVVFQVTPHASQRDLEVIDGSEVNLNWNARWSVRTQISENYWTAEIAIPWRNLRYPIDAQRFGVIFSRNVRSLNEQTSLPAVPRVFSTYRMAYEGEIHGIVPPPPGLNAQVNPYVASKHLQETGADNESTFDFGGEAKWAITPNTVLDLTVNTDFAQADADLQVINLDRFSVFFPERRQFFLESANIFNASVTEWIRPFFSRRIGLDDFGNPIPLDGGLRLTSRSAKQQYGVLAMRQQALDTSPASDFAVARYSRNVSDQSRIGGMLTYRQDESIDSDDFSLPKNTNMTYTVDGLWRPTQSFGIQAMMSASNDDKTGSGLGGQLWAFYQTNRVYLSSLNYYSKDYNPGVGLELLDSNYVMNNLTTSFDLRSEKLPGFIRSFNPGASAFVFRSADDGDLMFAFAPIRPLRLRFQTGAQIDFYIEPNWQRLDSSFSPVGIEIGPGKYDYTRYRISAKTDQSAKYSAQLKVETGDYFDGSLTSYSLSARVAPLPQVELSADLQLNQIRDLGIANEDKNTRLYRINARFALNPRLQFSGLYQWDSLTDRSGWNIRMSWEYRPLSYFYLVYNKNETQQPTRGARFSQDQFIAKLTYLFEM
jgi:hypothetical protein